MAHYIALNKSRYKFSHERNYLPIKNLSKYLRGEPCFMHLSVDSDNKRTAFCSAMNYVYRPIEFEKKCAYWFWSWLEVMTITEANRRKVPKKEQYAFIGDHPQKTKKVAVKRTKRFIPKIDWNFFGDAKKLSEPMTKPPRHNRYSTVPEYDEEHCRKFMVAFMPFRKESDIKTMDSYKRMFIREHSKGTFSEFIHVSQNIQNIRNSFDAKTMNNDLPAEEVDPETASFEDTNKSEEFWNRIAGVFGDDLLGTQMTDEPNVFDFSQPKISKHMMVDSGVETIKEDVFVKNGAQKKKKKRYEIHKKRYISNVSGPSGLNTIVKNAINISTTDGEEEIVETTGTVESIMAFGYNRNLDLDQQIAFEILTSTVVLSFVEDAIRRSEEDSSTEDVTALEKCATELRDMSQAKIRENEPLRMFLTGPAGAGKCK